MNRVVCQLHSACHSGDIDVVKSILKKGPREILHCIYIKRTCLDCACSSGNIEMIEYILSLKSRINRLERVSKDGMIVLHHACDSKDPTVLKYLLEKEPELINLCTAKSPISHKALDCGLDMLKVIIEAKPNLINECLENDSLMDKAIRNKNLNVMKYIHSKNPNIVRWGNKFNCSIIAKNNFDRECVKYLFEIFPDAIVDQFENYEGKLFTYGLAAKKFKFMISCITDHMIIKKLMDYRIIMYNYGDIVNDRHIDLTKFQRKKSAI